MLLLIYLLKFVAFLRQDGFKVKLHVYDLSQGLARQLSATFLGKAIEAVW